MVQSAWCRITFSLVTFSLVGFCAVLVTTTLPSLAQGGLVSIVIVRHPETDTSQSDKPIVPLSAAGRARAALLAHTLKDLKFTHMFASHTTRSRDAIAELAAIHNLAIVQLPQPGSMVDGKPVTDQTSRRAPIEPLSKALMELPAGSVALVGLNSENIYAILNRLGVPRAAEGQPCSRGSMCVPCDSNACFPAEFDHVWHLLRDQARKEPVALFEFRYGAGWKAPQ
jgi:hypothetical protein